MYLLQNVNLIYFLFVACAVSQWTNTGRRYALNFIIYTATFGNKQTNASLCFRIVGKKKKINLYYGLLSFARGVKKLFSSRACKYSGKKLITIIVYRARSVRWGNVAQSLWTACRPVLNFGKPRGAKRNPAI